MASLFNAPGILKRRIFLLTLLILLTKAEHLLAGLHLHERAFPIQSRARLCAVCLGHRHTNEWSSEQKISKTRQLHWKMM